MTSATNDPVRLGGPTYRSREETPREAANTKRAAELACAEPGIPIQRCSVDFYGDGEIAKVYVAGRVVTVRL